MRLKEGKRSFRYRVPDSDQILELSSAVIQTFAHHRQVGHLPEAGGLLFARFYLPLIVIEEATGPSPLDKRTRHSFFPCKGIRRRLIRHRFDVGLHFVGEWHTHPQTRPTPSRMDLESMYDSFIRSKHDLNAFVLIIVGTRKPDLSLWVSLHNKSGVRRATRLLGDDP